MSKQEYFIAVGEPECERLNILNEVYNPASKAFLQQAGLKKDMHILEVGCGNGTMSAWLSEQVGETGSVTSIDASKEQIETAEAHILEKEVRNVYLHTMSVFDLHMFEEKFDLIYNRFLLVHLQDPEIALTTMSDALKPDGILVCESAIHSNTFSDPESNYDAFVALAIQLFKVQNKDADFGKHLYSTVKNTGLNNIHMQLHQPLLNDKRKKLLMPLALSPTLKSFMIGNDIATREQLDTLEQALYQEAGMERTGVSAGVC